MTPSRACLSSLLLAVVVSACGEDEVPPPPPVLEVTLAGPGTVHCSSTPVSISATITGGTPERVELFQDGDLRTSLTAPYAFSFDCASQQERTYVFSVRASLQGHDFTSAPQQIVVDRVRPTIVSGPFTAADIEIAKDAPVRITFSEPMRTSQIVPASVELAGGTVKALSWSADQKVLTVELQPVAAPQPFTLSLRALDFQDLAGNALVSSATTSWSWEIPAFLTQWTLPRYGNGLAFLDQPAFARDRSGRYIIAWFEYTQATGAADVYVHRTGVGGNIKLGGPLSAVPGSGSWISEVKAAADASGRPVVAWIEKDTDQQKKVFVRRWSGTSWEELGGVPNPVIGADAMDLALAVGNSDLPVLAWVEEDLGPKARVYVYRWNGQAWNAVGNAIEARAGTGHALHPSLVVDNQGRPVLAVTEKRSPGDTFVEQALVLRWSGSAWEQIGSPIRPEGVNANASVNRTSLAVDFRDRPSLAFELSTPGTVLAYEVYFSRHEEAGWSKPLRLDSPSAMRPSLGFDAQGVPWVAWDNGQSDSNSLVQMRKMEGNAPPASLPGVYRPTFAQGGVDAPHLLIVDQQQGVARVVKRQ